MALPTATTTIDVIEKTGAAYEAQTETTVFSAVRAVFSAPRGSSQIVGGEESVTDMELYCDPIALKYNHIVNNNMTNERWEVIWVTQRRAVGLDHCQAGVNRVVGASGGF